MSRGRRGWWRWVGGGVVVLAVAAGCSTDHASGDTGTAAARHGATTTTAPTTTTTTRPPNPYAGRIPHFDPPPPARKVSLPPGQAAWLSRIDTDQPVAFITIDDGYVRHPEALALIRDSKVPVTLFLISTVAAEDPQFFRNIQQQANATIEAHTIDHARMRGMSYAGQRHEVCGSADALGQMFGRRPTLFRAPGGLKDANTLRAAADCGMKAVFFWHEAVNNGQVQFQAGTRVQRGDVILMHFRKTFVEDYLAALQGIKDAGLTPARLEDYVG